MKVAHWLPGAACVVLTLLAWELLVRSGAINPVLLPAPSTIVQALAAIVRDEPFAGPLARTLALVGGGYGIACMLGVAVGVAMGESEAAYRLLEPLVELVRPIPKPALIPPLFLFLGMGNSTMLFIIALGGFFPVLINTVQGVRGIDPVLRGTARTLRLARHAVVLRIVLPAALPMVMAGMRVSLGLSLTLVIVAEMLAGEGGVGFLILDMQRAFRVPQMYAWLAVLAALGLLLNAAFQWAEDTAMPWRGRQA